MRSPRFSRREFLKLTALSALTLATPPAFRNTRRLAARSKTGGDVLSAEQRRRLNEAARSFIAPDFASARQISLDVDFIEGPYEDASTMCGPLAIAILQKAGLLGAWATRHDFWLVDPEVNVQPFRDAFPESLYDWFDFTEPVSQIVPCEFQLLTGDLLYLHAAPGDTYEHVIVVNRVDEAGRAYTICNLFVGDGTIIDERLLYDPAAPGTGQLADWANRSLRREMGNTGSGGFHVWRVKDGASLELPQDAASLQLREQMDDVLLGAVGTWFGLLKQIDGPLIYQINPFASFHPASTIKVPIGLAFFHWLEGEEVADWNGYLSERGVGGRTYNQLLRAMLVESEELATQTLVDFLDVAWLDELWAAWGLARTHADPRRSSATDLAAAFENLYLGNWVSAPARARLLALLATYTSSDNTRLGLLRPQMPAGTRIYNKRGSLVDWPRVVGDSGIIRLPGSSAPAFIFTLHGIGKDEAGYEELEATLDQAISILGTYLKEQTS